MEGMTMCEKCTKLQRVRKNTENADYVFGGVPYSNLACLREAQEKAAATGAWREEGPEPLSHTQLLAFCGVDEHQGKLAFG